MINLGNDFIFKTSENNINFPQSIRNNQTMYYILSEKEIAIKQM